MSSVTSPPARAPRPPACAPPPPPASFQLRFAPTHVLGRSRLAPHRPRGWPSTVTGKFYTREPRDEHSASADEHEQSKWLSRVRRHFELTRRHNYAQPLTSQHEYGWYQNEGAIIKLRQWQRTDPACRLMRHPIREILTKM